MLQKPIPFPFLADLCLRDSVRRWRAGAGGGGRPREATTQALLGHPPPSAPLSRVRLSGCEHEPVVLTPVPRGASTQGTPVTPVGCPTVPLSSDTAHPHTASDPSGEALGPPARPHLRGPLCVR